MFDLHTPVMETEDPAPGRRVRVTRSEYQESDVHHSLYLPPEWTARAVAAGQRFPLIVEYTGNFHPPSGSTGLVSDANLGYGMTGGRGWIWVVMPCVDPAAGKNAIRWWGDIEETVRYCRETIREIMDGYGGDPNAVIICGFSRGAIGAGYIGLHNDEIASLWSGFATHDHFDGVRDWDYPGGSVEEGAVRLRRLGGRPVLVCSGMGDENAQEVEGRLRHFSDYATFTFLRVPVPEILRIPEEVPHQHTDLWLHTPSRERGTVRAWFAERAGGKAL